MDDLERLYEKAQSYPRQLRTLTEEWRQNLKSLLWGDAIPSFNVQEGVNSVSIASPQQTKKRARRLSSLKEEGVTETDSSGNTISDINGSENTVSSVPIPAPRTGLKNSVATQSAKNLSESSHLMPPPSAPVLTCQESDVTIPVLETSNYSGRPIRSARIKGEKLLKEPKLNSKLRRPSNFGVDITIKKEPEQRNSQSFINSTHNSNESISVNNNHDDDNVIAITTAMEPNICTNYTVTTNDQTKNDLSEELSQNIRQLRIKIKREKISLECPNSTTADTMSKVEKENKDTSTTIEQLQMSTSKSTVEVQSKVQSASVSGTENDAITTSMAQLALVTNDNVSTVTEHKKGATMKHKGTTSKKKAIVRPIKVERFSDLDEKSVAPSPIASRTRKASVVQKQKNDVTISVKEAILNELDEKKRSFGNNEMEQDKQNVKDKQQSGSIYEDAIESTTNMTEIDNHFPNSNTNATFNVIESHTYINNAIGSSNNNLQQKPDNTETEQNGCGTFIVDENINATHIVGNHLFDATFDVTNVGQKKNDGNCEGSFETAKDNTGQTNNNNNNSLTTGDESIHHTVTSKPHLKSSNISTTAAKATSATAIYNSTKPAATYTTSGLSSALRSFNKCSSTKTKELFNPLVQSPVKMRVKAFENAAAAPSSNGPTSKNVITLKKQKSNNSNTTPIIGKLQPSNLGRFLTPNQTTNIPLAAAAAGKKLPHSASKATSSTTSLYKSIGVSNVKQSAASGLGKAVHRGNSADDVRKGLDTQAEERKKQREQRTKMLAQAREAKERERLARLEKAKQGREIKRIQKVLEEEKKRQMEQINRKLQEQEVAEIELKKRQLEEARKQEKIAAAAKVQQQQQQEQQQQHFQKKYAMPPPPSKTPQYKYTFEMLHEYDSTDDEDKVSYKRPPPPTWSRSNVRGPDILMQQHMPSAVIDSFFSVQPITPDLKEIFPNINERHLKRNSSAFWNTPPRYSELPKY